MTDTHIVKSGFMRVLLWLRELWLSHGRKQGEPKEEAADISAEALEVFHLVHQLRVDPEFAPMLEECRRLVSEGPRRWYHRIEFRETVAVASAAMLVVAVVSAVYFAYPERYLTDIGEQRTVLLEDASTVVLNTNTRIKVKFGNGTRVVDLERGEAYFNVAPDKNRPFVVHAGGGVMRAVGTAFNVGISNGKVNLDVLEGSVDVLPSGAMTAVKGIDVAPRRISVGESVQYWPNGVIGRTGVAEEARIVAWRQGKLKFNNQFLVEAVAEHNRYAQEKIVIGSDDLKYLRVSGTFSIGDTQSLLFLLEATFGVEAVWRNGVIVLLSGNRLHTADAG